MKDLKKENKNNHFLPDCFMFYKCTFTTVLLLLFLTPSLKTQTVEVDSISHTINTLENALKTAPIAISSNVANPHYATLWALLPGGGQIYNWRYGDKWWLATMKLTAIYGGFGTLTYFTVRNTSDYREFRDAYKWKSTNGESGKKNKYTDNTTDQLQSYMNYYQSNVEWCYFFIGLLYGLQIVEATVTAHLLTFDISDNLSLSVRPLYLPDFSSPQAFSGISLSYRVQYK